MKSEIINLQNVAVYQQDNLVLQEVDISIQEGELVYLIGKTGSGKSSLLKSLYGLLPLEYGQGQVNNFDLHGLKKKHIPLLRRSLGIVFQDFQLLTDRSVSDNLLFVLKATGWSNKRDMQGRVEEVLDQVGLGTKGFKMPFELSGGEQQRVVIARALLNQPKLLLADEPTGNLDPQTSEDIMKLLVRLNREENMAMLIATHDYKMIEKFPSRILLCKGETIHEIDTSL